MATELFETIYQAFSQWRKNHHRGPFPSRLKTRARAALDQTELLELGARLGLTAAQVIRWGQSDQTRTLTPARMEAPHLERDAFIEIQGGRDVAEGTALAASDSRMEIELQMVSGAKLRVRGTMDAALLHTVVACLCNDAGRT